MVYKILNYHNPLKTWTFAGTKGRCHRKHFEDQQFSVLKLSKAIFPENDLADYGGFPKMI